MAVRMLVGKRRARPLDGGRVLADGRPLLGGSKTLVGLGTGLMAPVIVAPLVGLPAQTGAAVGAAAMLGDLTTSFVKRRIGLAPSANAPVLDQLLESLLPVLAVRGQLALSWMHALAVIVAFVIVDLALTPFVRILRRRRGAAR